MIVIVIIIIIIITISVVTKVESGSQILGKLCRSLADCG
jgi:hypothetical protein